MSGSPSRRCRIQRDLGLAVAFFPALGSPLRLPLPNPGQRFYIRRRRSVGESSQNKQSPEANRGLATAGNRIENESPVRFPRLRLPLLLHRPRERILSLCDLVTRLIRHRGRAWSSLRIGTPMSPTHHTLTPNAAQISPRRTASVWIQRVQPVARCLSLTRRLGQCLLFCCSSSRGLERTE